MNDENQFGNQDNENQDGDAIHLNANDGNYGATRIGSPLKRDKMAEEDGKLLTSRKIPGGPDPDGTNVASL